MSVSNPQSDLAKNNSQLNEDAYWKGWAANAVSTMDGSAYFIKSTYVHKLCHFLHQNVEQLEKQYTQLIWGLQLHLLSLGASKFSQQPERAQEMTLG